MPGIFGDDESLYLGLENDLQTAEEILRERRAGTVSEDNLPRPAPEPTRRATGGRAIAATGAEFELAPGDPDDTTPDEEDGPTGHAALLSVFPTSTTNPQRPRTLAAGYDHESRTMTVMFRDGTLYNYYQVSTTMWNGFKRAFSKGVWIRQNLDVRGPGLGSVATTQGGVQANNVRTYGRMLQGGRKGTQFKANGGDFGKPGAPVKPVKLSGYQNQVRKLMRQGASAEQAINEARRKINADFYKPK